jgi:hypothetical protein
MEDNSRRLLIDIIMDDKLKKLSTNKDRQSDESGGTAATAASTEATATDDEEPLSLEDWKTMCTKLLKDSGASKEDLERRSKQIEEIGSNDDMLGWFIDDFTSRKERLDDELKKNDAQQNLGPIVRPLIYDFDEAFERAKRMAHQKKVGETLNDIKPQLYPTAEDSRPVVVMMCGLAGK